MAVGASYVVPAPLPMPLPVPHPIAPPPPPPPPPPMPALPPASHSHSHSHSHSFAHSHTHSYSSQSHAHGHALGHGHGAAHGSGPAASPAGGVGPGSTPGRAYTYEPGAAVSRYMASKAQPIVAVGCDPFAVKLNDAMTIIAFRVIAPPIKAEPGSNNGGAAAVLTPANGGAGGVAGGGALSNGTPAAGSSGDGSAASSSSLAAAAPPFGSDKPRGMQYYLAVRQFDPVFERFYHLPSRRPNEREPMFRRRVDNKVTVLGLHLVRANAQQIDILKTRELVGGSASKCMDIYGSQQRCAKPCQAND
jgi:hypothetical protein